MKRRTRLLSLVFVLIGGLSPVRAAPISVADVPRLDLSGQVEWCESDRTAGPASVTAGGCRFLPASAKDLRPGFTEKAIWLRLTLINPADHQIERWLQIGHHRLTHVSFFEPADAGWKQTEAGMAVPIADRQVEAIDPILALNLKPHERRTVLVRVVSVAVIDLNPVLWQANVYLTGHRHRDFKDAIGVGGLLATAIVILAIYILWNARAYLYLFAFAVSMMALTATYSGQMQFYFWPSHWPFDVRIQVVAASIWVASYVLFVIEFVGRERYRRSRRILLILTGATFLAAAWACLVAYSSGALATMSLALITAAASSVLLWRGWQSGFNNIGILLAVISSYVLFRMASIALNLMQAVTADALTTSYFLQFVFTCLPAALIGLIVHKQRMQKQLALSQAESAARINFLAHMSHELRTPLDIIIGRVQLLTRPAHQATLAEGLAEISANGRQLLKMIDEVLDYSRGLVGKLALASDPVDWPAFLRGVEHDGAILAARNGNTASLNVSGERLQAIRIDERRLKQVLDNLVANAARHVQHGWIAIDCSAGPARADGKRQLEFAVRDSGEGIAPGDIERIFMPFERGGNSVRHGGRGVGMGLAISRQLVELMGGHLTIESALGKGATFRFQVIAAAADAAGIKAPVLDHIGGYAGPRRTVLVVDDEDDNRAIVAAMLRDSGFGVIEAASGQAAVSRLGEQPVDAVLTDQFMADGDGWHVLREAAGRHPGVPVLLISAAPPERPANLPAGINFQAHLLKPLNHTDVLQCLGRLLGLEWVAEAAKIPPMEAASAIERPDESVLAALRAMIEAGQISDIKTWAQTVQARWPQFAERIDAAAKDLDFAALNELASAACRVESGHV